MTDSRNKTTTVNYVHDTLSNLYGWMALLLDQETYSLQFDTPWINSSLQVTQEFIHSYDLFPQELLSFHLWNSNLQELASSGADKENCHNILVDECNLNISYGGYFYFSFF